VGPDEPPAPDVRARVAGDGLEVYPAPGLGPGRRLLAVENATGAPRRVRLLRGPGPRAAQDGAPLEAGAAWVVVGGDDAWPQTLELGPGKTGRVEVELEAGRHTVLCVRAASAVAEVVDGRCRPRTFVVDPPP
jgi:hypothetical protein